LRDHPNVFFAGQISGVEGYVESIATGLAAGRLAAEYLAGRELKPFPRESAIGSLLHYISHADPKRYQPANIAFDLLPPLENPSRDRRERQIAVCERAARSFEGYVAAQ
jgi:methylenetetrahydrofolate--tRNA-(uracil-5-)-methyltransferase